MFTERLGEWEWKEAPPAAAKYLPLHGKMLKLSLSSEASQERPVAASVSIFLDYALYKRREQKQRQKKKKAKHQKISWLKSRPLW